MLAPTRPDTPIVSPETPEPTTRPEPAEPASSPPWLLTTLAIGLMGTSAGMTFTGWTAWDYRSRYRRVLRKLTLDQRMNLSATADGGG